jgi:hypothetical protein
VSAIELSKLVVSQVTVYEDCDLASMEKRSKIVDRGKWLKIDPTFGIMCSSSFLNRDIYMGQSGDPKLRKTNPHIFSLVCFPCCFLALNHASPSIVYLFMCRDYMYLLWNTIWSFTSSFGLS